MKSSLYVFGLGMGIAFADAPKTQPRQSTQGGDPLASCMAQENKARVFLTSDEKKQLDLLEQKDNKARALRVVEHIMAHPGDYTGARSFLDQVGRERREKILLQVEGILKEWKGAAQKACASPMSEETFCKLKKRHDRYEDIERLLQEKKAFLLGESSYYEDLEAYISQWGLHSRNAAYYAAILVGGFILGRFSK